jgi:DNA-binding response OmpR family regulator
MDRILVVEDDHDIGELVRYNLAVIGLDVTLVSDGRPALRELQQGGFKLLVLDLMLPTVSGLEVCKAVRNSPEYGQLPILIVSARGEEAMRSLALQIGADDYLAKPFHPDELVARIRTLLAQSNQVPIASGNTG